MTDDQKKAAPDAVRKIVGAMVSQALARCEREGIALEDFYAAMQKEQELLPKGTLEQLFERIFRRLEKMTN